MTRLKARTPGTWRLWSASDPRWDLNGRGIVGGYELPCGAVVAIDYLAEILGADPPGDLVYEYEKDPDGDVTPLMPNPCQPPKPAPSA